MYKNERLYEVLKAGDVEKALKMLEENIYAESLKASGRKTSDLTIIKRLMKYNEKCNPRLNKWSEVDDYKFITEGHYGFFTKKELPCQKAEPHEALRSAKNILATKRDCNKAFVLDLSDLKAFYKLTKKDKTPYVVKIVKGGDIKYIAFNPQFMADCIEMCDVDLPVVHFNSEGFKKRVYKSSLFIEGEDTIAICLPVNLGQVDIEHPPIHNLEVNLD